MFEFTLLVNRKHTDPEKSNLPVKKKKKNKVLVADKRRGRKEKKEKYQPARFDDGSHESEEARLIPRSFDFHYKTLKKI